MDVPFGQRKRLVLLLVWLVSAAYVFPFRLRGWIPHDEGVLAQEAEYVLNGEMPHRDFVETYTGGLTYWNALVFRLFGLRLTSLRLALFLCFLAFVPAVFAIASRFGPPLLSGLITLLAVTWSVPNYFASFPSWYNLFLATWGTLALLRHIETGRRRWLFLAGVAAGISCIVKVIGAHFIAAALLFLVYREHQLSAPASRPPGLRRLSGFLFFKTAGLALFLALLFLMVRDRIGEMEFIHFLVPSATLCGFLIWREYHEGGGPFVRRFAVLMGLILPLAAGALLPILLFLLPFVLKDALHDFIGGVIIGSGGHVKYLRFFLPSPLAFWPAVPYMIVLGAGSLRRFRFAGIFMGLLAAALAAALWLSGSSPDVYVLIWHSLRSLGVTVVLAACLRLADAHRQEFWNSEIRQKIFLLAAVVAITALVQFPFAAPFYFFYFAPLVALAIFALVRSEPRPPRLVHAAMFAFYLLFALLRTNTAYVYSLGNRFERFDPPAILDLPRAGGLRVTAEDARMYGSLIPLVQEKSGGRPIYAGPGAQEINFLSGLADGAPRGANSPRNPLERPEELFRALQEKGTRVVVLNRAPPRARFRPALFTRFEELFPNSREINRFVVRWKD
jgi:hypothetical protein